MVEKSFSAISYLSHIYRALAQILYYILEHIILRIPTSYPGGPRSNKQTRLATRRATYSKIDGGWMFATDKDSMAVSQKLAPQYPMTGESAGRQIWYKSNDIAAESPAVTGVFPFQLSSIMDLKTFGLGLKEKSTNEEPILYPEFSSSSNPNSGDNIFRSIMLENWKGKRPDSKSRPTTAGESAVKSLEFYQMLQCDDGHWAGDYGGPLFLLPGLICVLYITKAPFPGWKKRGMIEYLMNHQQADGGFGTHIECASTMFGTVLCYVALRLLGQDADAVHMVNARGFIAQNGGALYAPSWAKFWLAAIGVYDWDGINSIPVEMWYLPRWFPFHPGKLWCHCRMVYLPMGYIYCKRFQPPDLASDLTLQALRKELYPNLDYSKIHWDSYRQTCADIDAYSPLSPIMKIAQDFLSFYERLLPSLPLMKKLRDAGLNFVMNYIHAEDLQTNYVDIGPVNKALNMLAVWVDSGFDTDCEAFKRHVCRVDDYLWLAEDGLKMQGYNGSQCWDTSFAAQAIAEAGLINRFPDCARKIYSYLERTQIKDDEMDREFFYRHISKGGWPFSTAAHGWPISDCTAEGLKSVLAFHNAAVHDVMFNTPDHSVKKISDDRLRDAVNVILTLHNSDGGWATYENNRGYRWFEMLNPSEVFGDIMIDYSYVECTSACVTALKDFSLAIPDHRTVEVMNAIQAGRYFLKSIQRADGSWYGSWGVCFNYGTWFGIEGLVAAGEDATESSHLRNAVGFLLSKQNTNGGWGESYLSSVNKDYPVDGTGRDLGEDCSGVVQTSWALLGLLAYVKHVDRGSLSPSLLDTIHRGIEFLRCKQDANGDWEQEGITGVFNRSCGITYTAYRNVFPLWALGRYANIFE